MSTGRDFCGATTSRPLWRRGSSCATLAAPVQAVRTWVDRQPGSIASHFVFVGREALDQPFEPGHVPSNAPQSTPEHFQSGYRYVFHRSLAFGIDESTLVENVLPDTIKAQGMVVDELQVFNLYLTGSAFRLTFKTGEHAATFFSTENGTIYDSEEYSARWSPFDYVLELAPIE